MLIVLALLYSQSFCEATVEIIIVNQQDLLVNYAPIICQKYNEIVMTKLILFYLTIVRFEFKYDL